MEKDKKVNDLRSLRENLKGMTFEQKIDHIFSYYWGTILLIILVPAALVILFGNLLKPQPDLIFSGDCTNVILGETGQSYVINDWNLLLDMEPGELLLNLSHTETAGLEAKDVDGGFQVLASIAADGLDYIFCDSAAMDFYAVQRAFLPVDQVLDTETLSQWSDRIYTYTDDEDGTTYSAAVDVSEMAFVRDCISAEGPVYLIFANKNEADTELLRLFWSHLEAWSGE